MSWREALRHAAERPLEFTLQYPPSREYFREHFRAPPDTREVTAQRRLLLYVHVPFCEAKCFYCNFAVDLRKGEALHARYVDALVAQLGRVDALLPEECTVPGIDVGGGTPTLLAPALLERVLEALRPWRRRCEVPWPLSIETTPRIAATDAGRLALLKAGGVDRVSMGLQSTHDETLAQVNRRAQRSLGDRAAEALAKCGFRRVNVDLVFGLPGQTREHWRRDLERVASLPVDSVTTYDCLYRGAGRAMPRLTEARPTPEDYGALYDSAYEYLTAHGFHAPYGSVNFSRHAGETGTSPYFEGRLLDGLPYLGTGNYASSLVGARWWFAPYTVDAYVAAVGAGEVLPQEDGYALPADELWAKYVLLSLNFGLIDPARFRRFSNGVELEAAFGPPIQHALEHGWLTRHADGVYGVAPSRFRDMFSLRALFYTAGAVDWLGRQATRSVPRAATG
ncbi:coproporphyrinogen-III oxidase family protein [Myxococcaceae bacterium GXIMD 01537]